MAIWLAGGRLASILILPKLVFLWEWLPAFVAEATAAE
jgi:hypothetical protein